MRCVFTAVYETIIAYYWSKVSIATGSAHIVSRLKGGDEVDMRAERISGSSKGGEGGSSMLCGWRSEQRSKEVEDAALKTVH